jgi:hypothetical protein
MTRVNRAGSGLEDNASEIAEASGVSSRTEMIAVVDHEHLEPEDVDETTLGGGDITPVSRTYGES